MIKTLSIVGGGISGLALAHALRHSHIHCSLYEKRKGLGDGTGILLSINSTRLLKKQGLLDSVLDKGARLTEMELYSHRGKRLSKISLNPLEEKYGVPMIGIHRTSFMDVLFQSLNHVDIQTQQEVVEFENNAQNTTLRLNDGHTVQADLLVGCDGLRSKMRQQVFQEGIQIYRYGGYKCWRGVCKTLAVNPHIFSETLGEGKRFGVVPIGKEAVYWYATQNEAIQTSPNLDEDHKQILEAIFQNFNPTILELIRETPSPNIVCHSIFQTTLPKIWYKNRVVLLGDSVHGMLPDLGQGAGMAIESAYCLGESLLSSNTLEIALKNYQNSRETRVRKIKNLSEKFSKVGRIENPVFEYIRNGAYSMLPNSIFLAQMETVF